MQGAGNLGRKVLPYAFVLPAILFLLIFTIYPLLDMVYMSFTDWKLVQPAKNFVGLHNYNYLFGRSDFWNALGNTVYYSVLTVVSASGSVARRCASESNGSSLDGPRCASIPTTIRTTCPVTASSCTGSSSAAHPRSTCS